MASPKERPLTLYPLTVLPKEQSLGGTPVAEWLQIDNVIKNAKTFRHRGVENYYSMVIDKGENGKLYGRFVKLKKDNVEKLIIDEKRFGEELQKTGEKEYIEANAYFVWDTNECLMLAEYNTDSVNILTGTSSNLLNQIFAQYDSLDEISLTPFPSKQFIQQIIEDRGYVSKYYLSFKDLNKSYLEELGLDGGIVWDIAEQGGLGLNFTINLERSKTLTEQFYERLKSIADRIFHMAKKFVVYTDEGNFDLIGEKFIYYNQGALIRDDIQAYRDEIYTTIQDTLLERVASLKGIRKKGKRKNVQLNLEDDF